MSEQSHPISHGYMVFIPVTCVMTLLSTMVVILRFMSRRLSASISWDDWAALAALIFAYGFLCTTVLVSVLSRGGYPITTFTVPELNQYFKIVLANNCLYNASVVMSKASILLFYRRIFVHQSFKKATLAVGSIVLGYLLVTEFGLIFAYTPANAQWNLSVQSTYKINSPKFWLAMGIVNILLDVTILALPQTQVWKLNRTFKRKLMVSLLFMLGSFVIVTSIIRVVYLETIELANITETLTIAGIWTMVEMNMSVVCACLPTLPGLFRYWYNGTLPNGQVRSKGSLLSLVERFKLLSLKRGSSPQKSDIEDQPKHEEFSSSVSSYAIGTSPNEETPKWKGLTPHQVSVRSDINIEETAR